MQMGLVGRFILERLVPTSKPSAILIEVDPNNHNVQNCTFHGPHFFFLSHLCMLYCKLDLQSLYVLENCNMPNLIEIEVCK